MANSKFEYVRNFELPDILLPNTWIVVRIDGRGFHKLSTKYGFRKPNDERALNLMNAAAAAVMTEIPELILAYGHSDEFSFVFHKDSTLFQRRASKLTTTIVSTFTAYYVQLWPQYIHDHSLSSPLPSFDGRAICYPTVKNLKDYVSWRYVDCHINNLYNTTFWTLIQRGGMTNAEAKQALTGTFTADKNEILFGRFGINYNKEPEIFRKGSVLFRDKTRDDYEDRKRKAPPPRPEAGSEPTSAPAGTEKATTSVPSEGELEAGAKVEAKVETNAEDVNQSLPSNSPTDLDKVPRPVKNPVIVAHLDLTKDNFWEDRPWILNRKNSAADMD